MAIPGAGEDPAIIKAPVAAHPKKLNSIWSDAGWDLKDMAVVDGRHLVLVFFVDHEARNIGGGVPGRLTKYTDKEDYAPHRAKCLKLATLRHYREQHGELEGIWDPMEGQSRLESTLEEMCARHDVRDVPYGAHLIATTVTYQTDDTSLIYCTSGMGADVSRHGHWKVTSRICDVQRFALLLGAEFARQRDAGRLAPVTGLDWLVAADCESSGLDSVVRVHHGPVVYNDEAGDVLFASVPEHARGLAAHFFKRTEFEKQNEYRFVLSASGERPIEDEFFLGISPALRSVFERA